MTVVPPSYGTTPIAQDLKDSDDRTVNLTQEILKERVKELYKVMEDKQGFDIYEFMALYTSTAINGGERCWPHPLADKLLRPFICIIVQIIGPLFVILYEIFIKLDKNSLCNISTFAGKEEEWTTTMTAYFNKILGLLFMLLVNYAINTEVEELYNPRVLYGAYFRKDEYMQHFYTKKELVDTSWIKVGFYTNLLSASLIIIASPLVILFSDQPLDIVLNSLGLLFLLKIDYEILNDGEISDLIKKAKVEINTKISQWDDKVVNKNNKSVENPKLVVNVLNGFFLIVGSICIFVCHW